MQTAEFEAEISNGIIEIPLLLRDRFQHRVRVRLIEETPASSDETILERWVKSPIEIPGFTPMSRDEGNER